MKRKLKGSPTYTHPRTAYKGIGERLALASLAFSETWKCTPRDTEFLTTTSYFHRVRFLSKKEGWECNFNWWDDNPRIDLNQRGVKRAIALGIEAARQRYFDAQHPSKELLSIVAAVKARKVA